jgi:hypothetical protein
VTVYLALLFVLDVSLVKEESQKEEEKNNRPVSFRVFRSVKDRLRFLTTINENMYVVCLKCSVNCTRKQTKQKVQTN